MSKKLFTLLDLCVSSLRRGHANLLCIVPILTDDPRRESNQQEPGIRPKLLTDRGFTDIPALVLWMKTANLGELLGEAATKFVEATPLVGRDPEPQIGSGAKRGVTRNFVGETLSTDERGN